MEAKLSIPEIACQQCGSVGLIINNIGERITARCKLSDISELVNETIHEVDDFLPDCVSVMVVARIMV